MIELDRAWTRHAKCRKAPTRVFFVHSGRVPDTETAMNYCQQCKVRTTCFCYATIRGERGIWGGTTEQERDARRPFILDVLVDLWPELSARELS